MKFKAREIIEFKSKGRFYISWRKKLKPQQIKDYFYHNSIKEGIKALFNDKKLKYCQPMHALYLGYEQGVKYENENGTYYLFWVAKSPQDEPALISVGKAVDGKIYVIEEVFPLGKHIVSFKEIPEEQINRKESGLIPIIYRNSIFAFPQMKELALELITVEDEKCIKIAYEGVRAFSNLIGEVSR